MAALVLSQQGRAVVTETIGPMKPKLFAIWSFIEKENCWSPSLDGGIYHWTSQEIGPILMGFRFWKEIENKQINIKISTGRKCYCKHKGDMLGSDTRPLRWSGQQSPVWGSDIWVENWMTKRQPHEDGTLQVENIREEEGGQRGRFMASGKRVTEESMCSPCLYRLSGTVRISLEVGDISWRVINRHVVHVKDNIRQEERLDHFRCFTPPQELATNLQNSPLSSHFSSLKYLGKDVTEWKLVEETSKSCNVQGPQAKNYRKGGERLL